MRRKYWAATTALQAGTPSRHRCCWHLPCVGRGGFSRHIFHSGSAGVSAGVITSILVHLYKTSRPHMAVVGRVPGTEHFRNVRRHKVETQPHVLSLRVDESLYFPNARFLEDQLLRFAADKPELTDVVLMFPAVNEIDLSALDSLEAINTRLDHAGIRLHLSEVKGPVMDRLKRSRFLDVLTGDVFLSQHEADISLTPENGRQSQGTDARAAL